MRPLFIFFDLNAISNHALVITVVTYIVVFLTLTILGFAMRYVHMASNFMYKQNRLRKNSSEEPAEPVQKITGDENAAIAAALFLYFSELHDEEKYVMTVKKVSRTYSPWSSKIYGIIHSLKS